MVILFWTTNQPNEFMVADIFTKPLQVERFRQLRKSLMGMAGEH